MAKPPAFQLYAADFDMDTASWTCQQVGVYMRLLMSEWVNGGLPNNMAGLARIARIDVRNMQKMWSTVIAKKFTTDDAGMYVNLRLESEREKQAIRREIQAQKGVNGAAKRWKGHIAPAIAQAQPNDSSSSSSLNNNTPLSPRKRGDEYDKDFLIFWSAYPKKAKKPTAYREWKKLGSRRPDITAITTAIANQKTWRPWIEGYIPDPERWLKNERWMDEKPPDGGNGNGNKTPPGYRTNIRGQVVPDESEALNARYYAGKAAEASARNRTAGVPDADDVPDFPVPVAG